jgi:hypothetical protein
MVFTFVLFVLGLFAVLAGIAFTIDAFTTRNTPDEERKSSYSTEACFFSTRRKARIACFIVPWLIPGGAILASHGWTEQRSEINRAEDQRVEDMYQQYMHWLSFAQVDESRQTFRVPSVGTVTFMDSYLPKLREAGWVFDGRRESFDYFKPITPEEADRAIITIKSILTQNARLVNERQDR